MPPISSWLLLEGVLPAVPTATQSPSFPSHQLILHPIRSQRELPKYVGEDLHRLSSRLLPPPPKPGTRERLFPSGWGQELTQGRDVCGRLSSSSTDGIRQLLPLCSHRLHSLHLFPFSARNNFGGGRALKNVSLMLLEVFGV